jgi:hypothetical protein
MDINNEIFALDSTTISCSINLLTRAEGKYSRGAVKVHTLIDLRGTVNDKLYSPEHKQHFEAKNLKVQIEKEPDNPNKLRLNLNGMNILEWFREKYQEMRQAIGNGKKQANDKSRQMKM